MNNFPKCAIASVAVAAAFGFAALGSATEAHAQPGQTWCPGAFDSDVCAPGPDVTTAGPDATDPWPVVSEPPDADGPSTGADDSDGGDS